MLLASCLLVVGLQPSWDRPGACLRGAFCSPELSLCGGHTAAASTKWRLARAGDAVVARVDATACRYLERAGQKPKFFASVMASPAPASKRKYLSESTGMFVDLPPFEPNSLGASYVFDAKAERFFVLVHHRSLRGQALLRFAEACWNIAWLRAAGPHTGQHASGWRRSHLAPDSHSIAMRVDTSAAGHTKVPNYVISLVANTPKMRLIGAHNVFDAYPTRFGVYVRSEFTQLSALEADQEGLHVNWIGSTAAFSGSSAGNSERWTRNSTFMSMEVKSATFLSVPLYVTSLQQGQGASREIQWFFGASFPRQATDQGFRAVIDGPRPAGLVRELNRDWAVSYIAFAPPADCELYDWMAWSACTKSCGGGTMHRQRRVDVAGNALGKPCGKLKEAKGCGGQHCPRDCEMRRWGTWSTCSRACGGGVLLRSRGIDHLAYHGGKACSATREQRHCNQLPCTEHGKGHRQACGGRTTPGHTEWTGYHSDSKTPGSMYVDVDTSSCGFHGSKTFYVASTLADAPVTTTIDRYDARHIRVNVWHPSLRGKRLVNTALNHEWSVSWMGDTGDQSGLTTPGKTGWRQNPGDKKAAFVDVDTAYARFNTAPMYVSTLTVGAGAHPVGGHNIYRSTRYGFMVYLAFEDTVDPDQVEESKVAVMWLGVPALQGSSSSTWQQHGPAIGLHVDTTHFGFPVTPTFVSSVSVGTGMPQQGMFGGSTVFKATKTGFSVFLGPAWHNAPLDAARAHREGWRVNFLAHLRMPCKVGPWIATQECSRSCGGGVKQTVRSVLVHPFREKACPVVKREASCGNAPCAVDCKVSAWHLLGPCSVTCGGGKREQMRSIARITLYGGKACPPLTRISQEACGILPCPAAHPQAHITGTIRVSGHIFALPKARRVAIAEVSIANTLGIAQQDVAVQSLAVAAASATLTFSAAASTRKKAHALLRRLKTKQYLIWLQVELAQQAFMPTFDTVQWHAPPALLSHARHSRGAAFAGALPPITAAESQARAGTRNHGRAVTIACALALLLLCAVSAVRKLDRGGSEAQAAMEMKLKRHQRPSVAAAVAAAVHAERTAGASYQSDAAEGGAAAATFSFDDGDDVTLFGASEHGV